jgi:hypothetical protein
MPADQFAGWLHEREKLTGRRTAPGHQAALSAVGSTAEDKNSEQVSGAYRRLVRAVKKRRLMRSYGSGDGTAPDSDA